MFHKKLKEYRESIGYSIGECARMTGTTPGKWKAMEHGITAPNLSLMFQICKLLECTPNDLLSGSRTRTLDVSDLDESAVDLLKALAKRLRQTKISDT